MYIRFDKEIDFDDLSPVDIDYRLFHDILDVAYQALCDSNDPRKDELDKVINELYGQRKIHLFFPKDSQPRTK